MSEDKHEKNCIFCNNGFNVTVHNANQIVEGHYCEGVIICPMSHMKITSYLLLKEKIIKNAYKR